MADLPESSVFDPGVYQLETTDAVVGGVDGKSNAAAKNLANRTRYLKDRVDTLETVVTQAEAEAGTSTGVKGWSALRVKQAAAVVVNAVINAAPAALDTLSELAAALGNDANFATTITNLIAAKAPLLSPALIGTPTAPTAPAGTSTDQVASTAFVVNEIASGAADYIVRYTTTGNLALTGLGTQAGGDWSAALTAGDLILVANQTTGGENGWYNAAAGAWTRASFADTSAEIKSGVLTQVAEGVTRADSIWMLATDGVITLAATALAFVLRTPAVRSLLLSDITLYVSPAGSDSNNGLTAGSPLLTIQKAIDTLIKGYDISGYTAKIKLADGTYTTGLQFFTSIVGAGAPGSLVVEGNTATPSNVVIRTTNLTAVDVQNGNKLRLQYLKLETVTAGNCVSALHNGVVNIGAGVILGSCGGNHLNSSNGGSIVVESGYSVVGGAAYHLAVYDGGRFDCTGMALTLTGTPQFGAFAQVYNLGFVKIPGCTFTGGATGLRHSIAANGVINTSGGGANYLPGDATVAPASGGQYI